MSNRPCVLFISPQPFYEDRGTPIAVYQELKAYRELNFNIHLLTYPIGREVTLPGIRIIRVINPYRCRSVPIGLSRHKLLFDFLILLKALELIRQFRYDFIHCVEESVYMGLLCKWMFGVPVIYDMHSSLTEQLRESKIFNHGFVIRLATLMENVGIRHADCLIGSHGLASHINSIAPGKIFHECRFEADSLPPKNLSLARRLGIEDQSLLVYAGNFSSYQGIDLLIEATVLVRQAIPHFKLLLVGGTKDEILSIERKLQRHRLSNTVILLQRRPQQEILGYLALGDALVMPRPRGLNAPMKIYTYILANKPIVATNIPAHTSILDEETAILVNPDPQSLSEGIVCALTNKKRIKQITDTSRSVFRNNLKSPLKKTLLNASSWVLKEKLDNIIDLKESRT